MKKSDINLNISDLADSKFHWYKLELSTISSLWEKLFKTSSLYLIPIAINVELGLFGMKDIEYLFIKTY